MIQINKHVDLKDFLMLMDKNLIKTHQCAVAFGTGMTKADQSNGSTGIRQQRRKKVRCA